MLISFKKGIINSLDTRHLYLSLLNYAGSAVNGVQIRVQTNKLGNNELHVIKNITENSDQIKRYLATTSLSYGILIGGILVNNFIILALKSITRDHGIRKRLKDWCFEISSPTIRFLSSLVFLIEPLNESQSIKSTLSTLCQVIQSRPKQFISNLVYYIGVNQVRYHFMLYVNHMILDYILKSHKSENTKSKYVLIQTLYLILQNPILSSITISLLVTPFRNISNQYCKLLVDSVHQEKDQFSLVKLNPINITRKLIKEKGIFGALYSGISITFLMSLLKLGI